MSDMPPEFYVPAFGALLSAISILAGVVRFLYIGKEAQNAKFLEIALESAKAIALNTEALRDDTQALSKVAQATTPPPRGSRNA